MSRLSSSEILIALIFIVLGLLLLGSNLGLPFFNLNLIGPLILVLIGVWLIWRALNPGQAAKGFYNASFGFGDFRPDLAGSDLKRVNFSHGFGDFDLDLTRATLADGVNAVRASHGFGDLTVIVPRDVALRVHTSAGFGQAKLFGERAEGIAPHLSFQADDYAAAPRKLDLDASVGFGQVRVMRQE